MKLVPVLFLAASSLPWAQSFPVTSSRKLADGQNGFVRSVAGATASGWLGAAAAPLGDLDGDGISDLALGQTETIAGSGGRIYVCLLEADGSVRTSEEIGAGVGGLVGAVEAFDDFGADVAWLGDLDGDGAAEVAVGAPGDDDGVSGTGAVWILSLNADGSLAGETKISMLTEPSLGLAFGDAFGEAVEALGDLDGDGVCDLAVGAPGTDDGGAGRGAFHVLHLRADGSVKTHQRVSSTSGLFSGVLDDGARFGASLASLGDRDGNGSTELAVGAPAARTDGIVTGAVWSVSLFGNGLVLASFELKPGSSGFIGPLKLNDGFGTALSTLGDLDGDGLVDLAVGVPGHDAPGGFQQGAVWILYLLGDGSVRVQDLVTCEEGGLADGLLDNNDIFGSSLALVGGLGRSRPQLVVGAPGDDDDASSAGAAHVLSLELCPPVAQAVFRSVPGNPASYDAPPPVLGELWEPTVNLRKTGHTSAWIFGMTDAFQLPLSGGQTLLVVDATGSGELLGFAPESGPLARFSAPVPLDSTYCGAVVYTQAVHLGGGMPFALSNAQDLVLGVRPPSRPPARAPQPVSRF